MEFGIYLKIYIFLLYMTKSSEYKTLSTEYTNIMLYIIAQIIIFRKKFTIGVKKSQKYQIFVHNMRSSQ